MTKPEIGAQLYTLRKYTKTLPDIINTLNKVAKIGYKTVQASGFGEADAKDVAKAAGDAGLRIVSTHTGWNLYLEQLDKVIADHKLWKCPHPAIGGLPIEYHCADGVKKFLDELAPVSEKLRAEGMDFSYHNHRHELVKYGNKTWLAQIYDNSSPSVLKAEIDVYWIAAGGGDPADWIKRCDGRIPLLHCKDMSLIKVSEKCEQRFAEVGEGNLNWKAILDQAEQSGVEHLLVEQDDCYGQDPFEALAISYRNLTTWGYK